MPIEPIDDPADPRLDPYRDIKDAGLRARHGLFVAESREVVRRLLASPRFRTRSVLLTAAALAGLREALAAAPSVPVYLIRHEVARGVIGYGFHRGAIALGERDTEPPLEQLLARGPRVVVALEDVSNPDNVGGVFRNARALGADLVLLSAGSADPLYRKTIRVSMGAVLDTPFARLHPWAEGLGRLHAASYRLIALTPHADAQDIVRVGQALAGAPRVALLLGSEGPGLSAPTLAAADLHVRIAMAPGVDSMNVATAAAIALHRLRSPAVTSPP